MFCFLWVVFELLKIHIQIFHWVYNVGQTSMIWLIYLSLHFRVAVPQRMSDLKFKPMFMSSGWNVLNAFWGLLLLNSCSLYVSNTHMFLKKVFLLQFLRPCAMSWFFAFYSIEHTVLAIFALLTETMSAIFPFCAVCWYSWLLLTF